jgi:hypothetical protein
VPSVHSERLAIEPAHAAAAWVRPVPALRGPAAVPVLASGLDPEEETAMYRVAGLVEVDHDSDRVLAAKTVALRRMD